MKKSEKYEGLQYILNPNTRYYELREKKELDNYIWFVANEIKIVPLEVTTTNDGRRLKLLASREKNKCGGSLFQELIVGSDNKNYFLFIIYNHLSRGKEKGYIGYGCQFSDDMKTISIFKLGSTELHSGSDAFTYFLGLIPNSDIRNNSVTDNEK